MAEERLGRTYASAEKRGLSQANSWSFMTERRRFQRVAAEMSALIVHGTSGKRDCVVCNISQGGACIERPEGFPVPEQLVLTIPQRRFCCSCAVVWSDEKRIGVSFASAGSSICLP